MKANLYAVSAIAAVATFVFFEHGNVAAAEEAAAAKMAAPRGIATPLDWAFDIVVNKRSAAQHLSPSDTHIAREQLQFQFLSLSPGQQQEVLSATHNLAGEAGAYQAVQALSIAVQATAQLALSDRQAKKGTAYVGRQTGNVQEKVSGSGLNQIFVATQGPCRVLDSRVGGAEWSGQIPSLSARQVWTVSDGAGYNFANQGGSGIAGSGNCTGTVYPGVDSGNGPYDVVATVTVTNTTSTGAMRAWDGSPLLTVGSMLNWNAGETLANTTVVPMDRNASEYPSSGPYKRDIGIYNNSLAGVDVIVDVLGYFIPPPPAVGVFGSKAMSLAVPGFANLASWQVVAGDAAGGYIEYTIVATDGGAQIASERGTIKYDATSNAITCSVDVTSKLHLGTVNSGCTPGFFNPGSQPGISIFDNVSFPVPAAVATHTVYFEIHNVSVSTMRLEP